MSDVTRRDAIKLILAAGAVASAGCDGPSLGRAEPATSGEAQPQLATATEGVTQTRTILDLQPLGFPWQTRDPFLFCVHHDDHYPLGNPQLGPAASLAGRDIGQDFAGKDGWRMYHGEVVPGFPQHPHRGFETVTVVRRGLLDHADSLGAAARYGEGDVQWLTAGKGIQHAEMFPLLNAASPNPVELFQIWLNLPRAKKMVDPHFSMFWQQSIPQHESRDAAGRKTRLTVVAGRYAEAVPPAPPPNSWAAQSDSDVAIWSLQLEPFARWTLPAAQATTHRNLYFFRGSRLSIDGVNIEANQVAQLRAQLDVQLVAGPEPCELLLLQGRPIGEPVARRGPFVMNTPQEIAQAFADYQSSQFGGWPWDRRDPVHGPEATRFARHADGRKERPG